MANDAWRDRLDQAVERDGRSLRQISLSAGVSHGYLFGVLREGKEPTLDRFVRICGALDLSVSYALLGAELTPETEQIVAALQGDDEARRAMLAILGRRSKVGAP